MTVSTLSLAFFPPFFPTTSLHWFATGSESGNPGTGTHLRKRHRLWPTVHRRPLVGESVFKAEAKQIKKKRCNRNPWVFDTRISCFIHTCSSPWAQKQREGSEPITDTARARQTKRKDTPKDRVEEITDGSTNQGFSLKVASLLPPHQTPFTSVRKSNETSAGFLLNYLSNEGREWHLITWPQI